MLLREEGDATLCIGQTSHAWISGQLARAWRGVKPFEAVVLAAEQHDVGWSEWDLEPEVDPETALPRDFVSMPLDARLSIWEPAPHRLRAQSLYAALLVSLHGTSLHAGQDGAEAYLASERELQETWIAQLAADRRQLDRNRRLILLWDALSLALCLRWDPYERDGHTLRRTHDETFTLDPWPFASDGPLELVCEGRRLSGPYSGPASLASAPLVPLCFTLTPA